MSWVRWLKYRDRTLDAWVNDHWQTAQTAFFRMDTVEDRKIHIPLPVYKGREPINELSGKDLEPTFRQKTAVVLITGEGGAGKTSLACQIAQWGLQKQLCRHRLLPVLIETELDAQKTLFEAIRGQVNALTNQPEAIAPELFGEFAMGSRGIVT